ncbi:MAG: hypothetical protein ACFB9M_21215 [Myxococcota bacterium]
MRVHRQQCQACKSRELQNLLVRESGRNDVVMVRCAKCRQLVARYELQSYYHHGKGFESWIRSYRGATESGRALHEAFNAAQETAVDQFGRVVEQLAKEGKE